MDIIEMKEVVLDFSSGLIFSHIYSLLLNLFMSVQNRATHVDLSLCTVFPVSFCLEASKQYVV